MDASKAPKLVEWLDPRFVSEAKKIVGKLDPRLVAVLRKRVKSISSVSEMLGEENDAVLAVISTVLAGSKYEGERETTGTGHGKFAYLCKVAAALDGNNKPVGSPLVLSRCF